MRSDLKVRLVRLGQKIQILRHFQELVSDMARLSDAWNASSSEMQKGLNTRDIQLLSKAILENGKQAKQMSFVLERYEHIVTKLGEDK